MGLLAGSQTEQKISPASWMAHMGQSARSQSIQRASTACACVQPHSAQSFSPAPIQYGCWRTALVLLAFLRAGFFVPAALAVGTADVESKSFAGQVRCR